MYMLRGGLARQGVPLFAYRKFCAWPQHTVERLAIDTLKPTGRRTEMAASEGSLEERTKETFMAAMLRGASEGKASLGRIWALA
eukprot:569921-Rhodomonas_salina.2